MWADAHARLLSDPSGRAKGGFAPELSQRTGCTRRGRPLDTRRGAWHIADMPPNRPRLRDRAAVAALLLAWTFPVLWHGVVSRRALPGEPRALHTCHDIACLFSDRPRVWHSFYVQVRGPGRPGWQTLELAPYFPMQPFGHRTRLHRYLIDWGEGHAAARAELAAWFFARHAALHPDARQPDELRFVMTWSAPSPERPPQGAWAPPPFEALPANRVRVLSMHRREGA
jgi:hypothetical protein